MSIYLLKDLDHKLAQGTAVIKRDDFSKVEHANELVRNAEIRAAEIIADAERHFQSEKKRGFTEGMEQSNRDAFERLLNEQLALDKKLSIIEGSLSSLVNACVRKLISTFSNTELAEATTRNALGKMRRENRVQLRVPIDLVAGFKKRVDVIVQDFPEIELIEVLEDSSLVSPNVILESSIGRIDCNFDNKLEDLEILLTRITAHLSGNAKTQITKGAPSTPELTSIEQPGGSEE